MIISPVTQIQVTIKSKATCIITKRAPCKSINLTVESIIIDTRIVLIKMAGHFASIGLGANGNANAIKNVASGNAHKKGTGAISWVKITEVIASIAEGMQLNIIHLNIANALRPSSPCISESPTSLGLSICIATTMTIKPRLNNIIFHKII